MLEVLLVSANIVIWVCPLCLIPPPLRHCGVCVCVCVSFPPPSTVGGIVEYLGSY